MSWLVQYFFGIILLYRLYFCKEDYVNGSHNNIASYMYEAYPQDLCRM